MSDTDRIMTALVSVGHSGAFHTAYVERCQACVERANAIDDLAALRRSRNAWRAACVFGLLCALAVAVVGWRMMP